MSFGHFQDTWLVTGYYFSERKEIILDNKIVHCFVTVTSICHVTGYSRPGITPCLPQDARLVRDTLQQDIAEDVDTLEMTNLTAIALLVVEIVIASVTLTALCVKNFKNDPRLRPSVPRVAQVTNHRRTICESEINPIQI